LVGAAEGSMSGPFWPQPASSNPANMRAASAALRLPQGVAPKISFARFFFITEL
jgi:hypothetical protein